MPRTLKPLFEVDPYWVVIDCMETIVGRWDPAPVLIIEQLGVVYTSTMLRFLCWLNEQPEMVPWTVSGGTHLYGGRLHRTNLFERALAIQFPSVSNLQRNEALLLFYKNEQEERM